MKPTMLKFINKINVLFVFLALICFYGSSAFCLCFPLPDEGDIVGELQTTTVGAGESLGDIGRRFDVGVCEMIEANPNLDPWVPMANATVIVPTQFILPKGARTGIVLNLAEMRLYYFHPDKKMVTTHPIGIGKKGWSTPLGNTTIIRKKKDPIWTPPISIRKEHLDKGDVLPDYVPAGPDNPLGRYAFYLGFKGFLVHGSNRVGGVGVRGSHGCIRLLPADIENLFNIVPLGTPVCIIHEPFKAGWYKNRLYLEAHNPLTEPQYLDSNSQSRLAHVIENAISGSHLVNWTSAKLAAKTANGYPVRID